MTDPLIIAAVTGVLSSVMTIAAIKTDITWIKRVISQQHKRISKLEGKIL